MTNALIKHLTKIARLPSAKRDQARRENALRLNATRDYLSERVCSKCNINRLGHQNESGICRECRRKPKGLAK